MGSRDEGADQSRSDSHSDHRPTEFPAQFSDVVVRAAREFVVLQVPPDPIVGVELRTVTRESVHLEARMRSEEGAGLVGPVQAAPVPEDPDRPSADVPQQCGRNSITWGVAVVSLCTLMYRFPRGVTPLIAENFGHLPWWMSTGV